MLIPRTFSKMIQYVKDQVSVMNIPMKYRVDLLGMISAVETRHEQDMPKWIPCSERLPDGQTEVIVSCHDDSGDAPFDYTSCGWITTDKEYWIVDNEINNFVVAWMELPKPWEGDTDGKER